MAEVDKQIEQQVTVLLRRVQRIHVSTSEGDVYLDRSAYGASHRGRLAAAEAGQRST